MQVLMWVVAASAQVTCPWPPGQTLTADASKWELVVNGKPYDISTKEMRAAFAATLRECDMGRAAYLFERWKSLFGGGYKFDLLAEIGIGPPVPPPPPEPKREREPETLCLVPNTALAVGWTQIKYLPGQQVAASEAKSAEAEMRPTRPTPPLGEIAFLISRETIGLADQGNHILILENDGRQILRYEPSGIGTSPQIPRGEGGWWDLVTVPIPSTAVLPLRVHAADRAMRHRCSWEIGSDGKVHLFEKPPPYVPMEEPPPPPEGVIEWTRIPAEEE